VKPALASIALSVCALTLAACSSDAKIAATATKGDAFCLAAQKVKTESKALSSLIVTGKPADLEAAFNKLLAEAKADVAIAPADAKAIFQKSIDLETQVGQALKKFNWDFLKAAQDPETRKQFDAIDAYKDDENYLLDKCGIATSSSSPTDTATPALGSSTLSSSEALDRMIDLYAIGTKKTVDPSVRVCLHAELDGKFTADILNKLVSGGSSALDPTTMQNVGLAFVKCGLATGS
jgi:hypothetical protein